jgi:hypothetical protein
MLFHFTSSRQACPINYYLYGKNPYHISLEDVRRIFSV